MKALNPSSPLFRFFRQVLSKKPSFPEKNEKKSWTASFPWRTIFPRRIFAFFWKTLSKKPLFSDKKFKNFPDASVPAGARHRHLSDDRTVTRHSLYSVFFGKRSEKNGLFSKKVRILPLWRPVHTQKIAKRSPPKKSSKPYIQKILAIDQRKKDFFQKKFRFCLSDVPAVCKNHETFHRFR